MNHSSEESTAGPRRGRTPWWLIPVVLSAIVGLTHIGHYSWTDPDEIIHSVVAMNLTNHWLEPTLHEVILGKPSRHWWHTHVWLHKPILPLWMSAVSIEVLGHTPFAFRLPALILQQCTIALIYAIGLRLYGWRTGLVAASLAAALPFSYHLLFGGQFCDIYDIGLAWWTTAGVYLFVMAVTTRRLRYYALLGLSTGLGYHTKWELGLFPLGLLLFYFLLQYLPWTRRPGWLEPGTRPPELLRGPSVRQVLLTFAVAAATIAPWVAYLAVRYPIELSLEHGVILSHLGHDVEGWARPWYQHLWPYLEYQYTAGFAVVVCVAVVALVASVVRSRSSSDLVCLVCLAGVFVSLSLARSKVPGGTYMIHAIIVVVVARVVVQAWSRGGWVRALVVPAFLVGVASPVRETLSLMPPGCYRTVPIYTLGRHIAESPDFDDAFFLVESDIRYANSATFQIDHFQLSFSTGRTAYQLEGKRQLDELAREARDKGLRPYLVTTRSRPQLPVVLSLDDNPYTIYDPLPSDVAWTR